MFDSNSHISSLYFSKFRSLVFYLTVCKSRGRHQATEVLLLLLLVQL